MKVNEIVTPKSTIVKKHFNRGEQLLEEKYIDIGSIHAKQNENVFCIKGVCASSLKKQNRWVFVSFDKKNRISFAVCQCPAGKAGTCSHVFSVMKLVAKWVVDRLTMIPDPVTCTHLNRVCGQSHRAGTE